MLRDKSKQNGNWSDYKKYRNKTQELIRKAKKQHFSISITNSKDTKTIWKHLRTATNDSISSQNSIPDELCVDGKTYTSSEEVAFRLNNYFAKISELFSENDDESTPSPDFTKLNDFITQRIPNNARFEIPFITETQVYEFINGLNIAKATGLDGIGPRILKLANNILAPSIAALINKSIKTATFPEQLKVAIPYIKVVLNLTL